MQLIKRLLFAVMLTIPGISIACLNEYYRTEVPITVNGRLNLSALLNAKDKVHPYWFYGFAEYKTLEDHPDAKKIDRVNEPAYKLASDNAVLELKRGDKNKAVEILEKLYAEHPTEYNIIANLGTAYELTGNNSKALELLKKAVAINPLAHHGSEWIHIGILEQKQGSMQYGQIINLNIQDFPQWLNDKSYVFTRPADSLKIQIAYQLHERIGFIAAPDSVIGQLVLDFADIVAKTESKDEAIAFYDYAATYSPALQSTIAARKAFLQEEKKTVQDTFRYASVVWAIPLIAFVLILLAWLKSMKRNKSGRPEDRMTGDR
jgi:tetratricopeptide (TPR) repeat protein